MTGHHDWLKISQGDAPLIVSIPHAGTHIPADIESELVSPWLARKDADWWVDRLYDFAGELGATTVHTTISRSVIDVNRDPSGKSLYPGQATTELCPTTTFDGEPLYKKKIVPPDTTIIVARRLHYFDPYHAATADEIARLRTIHDRVVLFEAHSIRSHVPRLFKGELPNFGIGTNSGASCAPELAPPWKKFAAPRAILMSPTAASMAVTPRAITASRKWACMRSSLSWRAAVIWTNPQDLRPGIGPRLTTRPALCPCARCYAKFSKATSSSPIPATR